MIRAVTENLRIGIKFAAEGTYTVESIGFSKAANEKARRIEMYK